MRRIPHLSRFASGRGDRTRTCGILVPNQALYQTELRLVVDVAHGGEKSPATEKFQALCALSFIDVSVKHLSASSDSLIIILPNARFVNRFFITLYTCTIMSCLKAIQMLFFNKLYRDIIRKHQKIVFVKEPFLKEWYNLMIFW